MNPLIILQIINAAISLALAFIVYKLYKRISIQNTSVMDNTISQMESLINFHRQLDGRPTIPSTRGWAASGDFLVHLINLCEENSPLTAVECSSGLSTVTLASAMAKKGQGHVYSLEHDELYAKKTRDLLKKFSLEEWATVIHAPLVEVKLEDWSGRWYDSSKLPQDISIDFLVIDGPPQSSSSMARYPSIPVLFDKFSSNAIVALDDAARDDEQEAVRRWLTNHKNLKQLPFYEAEKGIAVLSKN